MASAKGNLYMTYCLRMDEVAMNKLTLLPIGIGVLLAEAMDKSIRATIPDLAGRESIRRVVSDGGTNHHAVSTATYGTGAASPASATDRDESPWPSSTVARPTVKWPNDVLLGGRKVAGTLIETCRVQCDGDRSGWKIPGGDYWLMVGIGVNIESHPTDLLDAHPNKAGGTLVPKSTAPPRAATSLRQHCDCGQLPSPVKLGIELACEIERLVLGELSSKANDGQESLSYSGCSSPSTSASIVDRWRSWSNLGENYVLRDTGETVQTVDIEADGRLRVLGDDGKERMLVSDYFV